MSSVFTRYWTAREEMQPEHDSPCNQRE